jgi:hypothetical protein
MARTTLATRAEQQKRTEQEQQQEHVAKVEGGERGETSMSREIDVRVF